MIAKLLEAACRAQIRFFQREDTELQQVRAKAWADVEEAIGKLIDERIAASKPKMGRPPKVESGR